MKTWVSSNCMNESVASKTEKSEVFPRSILVIFVNMVKVNCFLAMACRAQFACAISLTPEIDGGLPVSGSKRSLLLSLRRYSGSGRSSLLRVLRPFTSIVLDSMLGTEGSRWKFIRIVAHEAETQATATSSLAFCAGTNFFTTRFARLVSGLKGLTASAFPSRSNQHGVDRVFMQACSSGNFPTRSQFLVKSNNFSVIATGSLWHKAMIPLRLARVHMY